MEASALAPELVEMLREAVANTLDPSTVRDFIGQLLKEIPTMTPGPATRAYDQAAAKVSQLETQAKRVLRLVDHVAVWSTMADVTRGVEDVTLRAIARKLSDDRGENLEAAGSYELISMLAAGIDLSPPQGLWPPPWKGLQAAATSAARFEALGRYLTECEPLRELPDRIRVYGRERGWPIMENPNIPSHNPRLPIDPAEALCRVMDNVRTVAVGAVGYHDRYRILSSPGGGLAGLRSHFDR